jgi:hypothetical protein
MNTFQRKMNLFKPSHRISLQCGDHYENENGPYRELGCKKRAAYLVLEAIK